MPFLILSQAIHRGVSYAERRRNRGILDNAKNYYM
jgi:hypothetical protein